ncbi:MAG: endonuclease/exonuclease/phosphatase family protein [Polyangiaceae bacterium]
MRAPLLPLLFLLLGCPPEPPPSRGERPSASATASGAGRARPRPTASATEAPPARIVVDGVLRDWFDVPLLASDPRGDGRDGIDVTQLRALVVGQELFVQLDTGGEVNLVAGPEGTVGLVLVLGLDGRTLRVDFRAREAQLGERRMKLGALGLVAAPTHAGRAFELRLDLEALGVRPGAPITLGLEGADPVAAVRVTERRDGSPPVTRSTAKPPGATIRLASLNTLEGGLDDPRRRAALQRLLKAAAADVYALQEVGRTSGERLAAQFGALDPHGDGAPWHVHHLALDDVVGGAIASRAPLTPIPTPSPRIVAAVVGLPSPVAVVDVHLKCCGYAGSPEDRERLAEAAEILAVVAELRMPVIVVGDFNDVGSAELDQRLSGELVHVPLRHLTDDAAFTWLSPTSPFPPGILDLLFVKGLTEKHQFLLDSRRLAASPRQSLGLEPDDSAASDHLLVVADLAPR